MFSSDNKATKQNKFNSAQQNIVAQGTTITGTIESTGLFRIDGTIEGDLKTAGKVVIGKTGFIKGTLHGENADFEGRFSGKMMLTGTLSLKSTARIEGEVQIQKLVVEPGAIFNATCSMKDGVKALNNEVQKSAAEQTSKRQA